MRVSKAQKVTAIYDTKSTKSTAARLEEILAREGKIPGAQSSAVCSIMDSSWVRSN